MACYKFIAADEGTSISYRSKTDEARKCNAAARRSERKQKATCDKENEFGPPDKRRHLSEKQSKKLTVTSVSVDESVIKIHQNLHPEVVGKRVRVKYENMDNGSDWYEGIIASFNCMTGMYGVFFPCDSKTEEFFLDEEEFVILD